jgi:hypothetical protein
MSGIDNWTLKSLLFELSINRPPDRLLPRSGIWPNNENTSHLVDTLLKTGLSDLRETLFLSHLLDPKNTPGSIKPWLAEQAESLIDQGIEILEKMSWCPAPLALTFDDKGFLCHILVGVGRNIPPVLGPHKNMLDREAVSALDSARTWMHNLNGFQLTVWPLPHAQRIQGSSLGLPCAMAALAALMDRPFPDILATGLVDVSGRVLPVSGIPLKVDLAHGLGKKILLSRDCIVSETHLENCVFLENMTQALDIILCPQAPALCIAELRRRLDQNKPMVRYLASEACIQVTPWIIRHRERLGPILAEDPDLAVLLDGLERNDSGRLSALLECFTLNLVQKMSQTTLAWRVAKMRLKQANHAGKTDESRMWAGFMKSLLPQIAATSDGENEELLFSILSIISSEHNTFSFSKNPLAQMEWAQDAFTKLQRNFAARCRRVGRACVDKLLGRYHGTLAQHTAFLGPRHLEKSLEHIRLAIQAFGSFQVPENRKDCRQDLTYKSLILSSAGKTGQALNALAELPDLYIKDWIPETMDSYQLHAFLRAHVDAGTGMDPDLWSRCARKKNSYSVGNTPHPLQLVAYNLALLAPDSKSAARLLAESANLCLSEKAGATIQIMALLPASALQVQNMEQNLAKRCVQTALEAIGSGALNRKHFSILLETSQKSNVLNVVRRNRARLFPFSYR